jgi:hypothetical protein
MYFFIYRKYSARDLDFEIILVNLMSFVPIDTDSPLHGMNVIFGAFDPRFLTI